MDASGIRTAWLKQLFSTEPADRPRAEAAARSLYAELGLPAPLHVLWFDSPRDGAWAAALLLEPEEEHWREVLRQAERTAAQRPALESMREHLRQNGVVSAGQSLKTRLGLFDARLGLYPDVQTAWQRAGVGGDKDDLHRAEGHLLGIARGVLGNQVSARPVGLLLQSSMLSLYPMSLMATDEAQAAGNPAPALLAALWKIARSCGPWWAFEHAVIFTDRPMEIHVNDRLLLNLADGPAAVYRDGWQVYAVDGHAIEPPKPKPSRSIKPKGRYLDRYLAGEHKQVWDELIALGSDVRKPRHLEAAKQVAQETMRRVAANVDALVERLLSIDYIFKEEDPHWYRAAERERPRRGTPKASEVRARVPPGPEAQQQLRELEELAGPLPLSLAAFYEIVGSVGLMGYHDTIAPDSGGHFLPDPLVVLPLDAMLQEIASGYSEGAITIAPDSFHKANFSGGAPYEMKLPDPRADGELLNESRGLFFVDYLRLAFRHGGFPGYEGIDRDLPPEIAMLSRDLLPF